MKIKFRDVSQGMVEARGTIEIEEGVLLNEITVIRKDGELKVELPQKSFMGKAGNKVYINIITFEDENKEVLWKLEVMKAYKAWRKANKKVLVYET